MSLTRKNTPFLIITKVMYQFVSNVLTIETGSTPFTRRVTFVTGTSWLDIPFSPGTASFAEPEVKTNHGPQFNQLLKIRFSEDTADFVADLQKIDMLPFIVKITLSDGSSKIIGTIGNPARHLSNFITDRDHTADEFSFSCTSQHRAYILEAVV
ncbi:MAG: hypothetical protein ACOYN5_04545 [Bacteroidales bacterium]